MRVLHALDHCLPAVSGYAIRSHAILRAQRAAGIDAIALARSPHVGRISEQAIEGVPYVRLPSASTMGSSTWRSSTGRIAQMARQLHREVRARDAALLHAHSPSLNGLAALWAGRRTRVPVVYEMRALWEDAAVARSLHDETALRYRTARAVETWLIGRVRALVVISHGLRDEALRRGVPAERIVCAPNGVDTELFRPIAPDADLVRAHDLAGQITFGYLGYFSAYEGVDILLRAFAQIAAVRARLVLVGNGDDDGFLRALAVELGIASRVVFVGAVSPAEVRRWYSVCDVFVYPRRASALTALVTPLKPLEAMAMGKPIVAAHVGGLAELIRDGETGLLFPPHDVDALAATLTALALQPQRRAVLGASARRFVCAARDWARLGAIYTDLYRRVLPGPGTGTGKNDAGAA